MIQSVLGLSFVLIWVFIGTLILRDRQLALRSERNRDNDRKPVARSTLSPPHARERVVQPGKRAGRRRDATAA